MNDVRVADRRITTSDFDPFAFNYLYRGLRHAPTYRVGAIGVVMVILLLGVNIAQGTMGRLEPDRIVMDVAVALGVRSSDEVSPDFPLARDIASWLLLFTIIAGAILLHRQWQLMSTCLSRLAANGALVAKRSSFQLDASGAVVTDENGRPVLDPTATYGLDMLSRLLGVNRILRDCPPSEALRRFINRVNARLTELRMPLLTANAVCALILASLLGLGQRSSLFISFAPEFSDAPDPAGARAQWLEAAYASWWAGTDHTAGYLLYGLFAAFAFFIILSFNYVGVIAIYVMLGLRYMCSPGADWFNRDGRYGFRPLAEVYRTVLFGVALLGLALTVTLITLGIDNYGWLGAVVVLYIVVTPTFIFVPRLVFRRASEIAKIDRIATLMSGVDERTIDDPAKHPTTATIIAEIERCHAAVIRPLRFRLGSASTTFLALFVLPMVLAAVQVFFPWLVGPPK